MVPANNAIIGGFDINGRQLYVCQSEHAGDVIPGKADPKGFGCAVSWGGKEHFKTSEYKLLVNPKGADVKWVWVKNNVVPDKAFVAGRSKSGDNIYVGRCKMKTSSWETQLIGKIHKVFYISFAGREFLGCKDYEILVC